MLFLCRMLVREETDDCNWQQDHSLQSKLPARSSPFVALYYVSVSVAPPAAFVLLLDASVIDA